MISPEVDAPLLTERGALHDSASTPPTQESSMLAEAMSSRNMGMLFQLLQPDPQSQTNAVPDLLFVATLQGPRPDNQDRAAIAIISSPDGESERNIVCFLVADGIATLTNGAQCAALGISAFISAMVSKSHLEITGRVTTALNFANLQCFRRFRGRSGTTLSVAVVTQKEVITGNAGDSRIYGLFGDALRRLTVDDSMNERLAGQPDIDPQYSSSKGLLQYVGMGEGFAAAVEAQSVLPDLILLTSDGLNQIPPSIVTAIILNADPRRAGQRLINLANWIGPVDNTTLAVGNTRAAAARAAGMPNGASQIITPAASHFVYFPIVPEFRNGAQTKPARHPPPDDDRKGVARETAERANAAVEVEIRQS